MKVIIAGGREITDYDVVFDAFNTSGFIATEIVSGGARGVDRLGEQVGKACGIPVKVFLADWNTHGKAAGPIRNAQMGDYADALVAIWDGQSKGTKHMIDYAKKKGLKVFVWRVDM